MQLLREQERHSGDSVGSPIKRVNFLEEYPEAKAPYEKLRKELAAGLARQAKAADELAIRSTENLGGDLPDEKPGQLDHMARIVLNGYVMELISFRNPLMPRRLPPGLSEELHGLSQRIEATRKRAWEVWSKLPPGPSRALVVLGLWCEDTSKLLKILNERNSLPKGVGRWNVVDEVIWGFLKSLKQITGHYHYADVAELATLCLDDRNDRHNIASLKMIVHRRKPRETKFRQALAKFEKQEELIPRTTCPGSSPQKRPPKR